MANQHSSSVRGKRAWKDQAELSGLQTQQSLYLHSPAQQADPVSAAAAACWQQLDYQLASYPLSPCWRLLFDDIQLRATTHVKGFVPFVGGQCWRNLAGKTPRSPPETSKYIM